MSLAVDLRLRYLRSQSSGWDTVAKAEAQEKELADLRKFKQEWSDRFGFLAVQNPRDSFASIDEVATILYERKES